MMNTSSNTVQPIAASPSRTKISKPRMKFVQAIIDHYFGSGTPLPTDGSFSRQTLLIISNTRMNKSWIPNWITHDKSRKSMRGSYFIPEVNQIAGSN